MATDDRYDRVVFRGAVMSKWTRQALLACERELGYPLTIMQGGSRPTTPYSGTTHRGLGAVDLSPWDAATKVMVLAANGFAVWHRLALPGVWGEHVHAELLDQNDPLTTDETRRQWADWRAVPPRDGLAHHAIDHGYRPAKIVPFDYKMGPVTVAKMTPLQELRHSFSMAVHQADAMAANNSADKKPKRHDAAVEARRLATKALTTLPKK